MREWDGDYCFASEGLLLMETQLPRLFVKGSRMGVERNEARPSEGRKRDVVLLWRGRLQLWERERKMHTDAHPSPTEAFCIAPLANEWANTVRSAWLLFFLFFFFCNCSEWGPQWGGWSSQQWKSWAPFRVITGPLIHCATQNHRDKFIVFVDYTHRSGGACRDGLMVKISLLFLQVCLVIPFVQVGY